MASYILKRLKEASTWRGLIGLFTAGGIALDPAQIEQIITVGIGFISLINVFKHDNK